MARVLFVYGTRPEAIKLAPVVLACREQGALEALVCVTAQHRGLLDDVGPVFGITPDWDLDLMRPNQALAELTARALEGLAEVIAQADPACVVVQGDTTTAMAAGLAAFYARVPVAHVEAGLRTRNVEAPFPEEVNRQVLARIARWHFAPTWRAGQHLATEAVSGHVEVTGNTSIDALRWVANQPPDMTALRGIRAALDTPGARCIVVTAHRRESFGAPLERICEGLRGVLEVDPNIHIVLPVHPNPNVRGAICRALGEHPRIAILEPLAYRPFIALLGCAWIIMTDSGGIQEEAPELGKPVLVLRDETERDEGLVAGTARLVGTDPVRMVACVRDLATNPETYARMAGAQNPFGDGRAAERIMARLVADLS